MTKTKSSLYLKEQPTLRDIQDYVVALEKERGFKKSNLKPIQTALQLGEEVGELFKAIRKREGITIAHDSTVSEIADELADILNFTAAIANRYSIDLEKAFRDKEEINKKRKWS